MRGEGEGGDAQKTGTSLKAGLGGAEADPRPAATRRRMDGPSRRTSTGFLTCTQTGPISHTSAEVGRRTRQE